MISKNEIKEIRALGQKKFRDERRLFTVEGEKLVEEAQRSCWEVVACYRVEDIGAEAMARISQLTHPSPALAVVRMPDPAAAPPVPRSDELVLALDGIRDPGNLGTIIRIADWFGIRTILASEDTVECFNPKVVQATMGAIFRVRVHYVDLPKVLRCPVKPGMTKEVKPGMTAARNGSGFAAESPVAEGQIPVYGTFLDGDDIYATALTKGGIIVIGSEANGISPEVAKTVTHRLFIPPYPKDTRTSESLNAAVATAITCAEFRRRG